MAETSLDVLKREGEIRGSSGHDPGAADFDEHVGFYKSTLRVAAIFIGQCSDKPPHDKDARARRSLPPLNSCEGLLVDASWTFTLIPLVWTSALPPPRDQATTLRSYRRSRPGSLLTTVGSDFSEEPALMGTNRTGAARVGNSAVASMRLGFSTRREKSVSLKGPPTTVPRRSSASGSL